MVVYVPGRTEIFGRDCHSEQTDQVEATTEPFCLGSLVVKTLVYHTGCAGAGFKSHPGSIFLKLV